MTGDKYNVPSPAALAFELPESRANYPAAPVALHRISELLPVVIPMRMTP